MSKPDERATMSLTIEQLCAERDRIILTLQKRLDTRAPWTDALREDASALRAIIAELSAREDDV